MKLVICFAVLLTATRALPLSFEDIMSNFQNHLTGLNIKDYHVEDDHSDELETYLPEEFKMMDTKTFRPGHPRENYAKSIKYKRGNNGNGRMNVRSKSFRIPSSDPNKGDTHVRAMSWSHSFSSHHPEDGSAGGEGNFSREDNQRFFENMSKYNPFSRLLNSGFSGSYGNPQVTQQEWSSPESQQCGNQYSQPQRVQWSSTPQWAYSGN